MGCASTPKHRWKLWALPAASPSLDSCVSATPAGRWKFCSSFRCDCSSFGDPSGLPLALCRGGQVSQPVAASPNPAPQRPIPRRCCTCRRAACCGRPTSPTPHSPTSRSKPCQCPCWQALGERGAGREEGCLVLEAPLFLLACVPGSGLCRLECFSLLAGHAGR